MAGPSDFAAPETPASMGADASGPDGRYAIRKGDIKVEPKLSANIHLSWAKEIQLLLEAKKLWRIVTGKVPMPDEDSRPVDHEEWTHDDTQARMWIRLNCEKNQHSHLRNKKTSKDAWDALKKVHGVQAKGRINLLLKRFHTYKAGPDESIDDIVTALENIKLEIADTKETHEPQDTLVAMAPMSAIEDSAYDTA